MSIRLKTKNQKLEKTLFGDHTKMPIKKLPAENIISNIQLLDITDPIDPKRISKEPTSCLNASSVVKAVLVFVGTIGLYNLFKNKSIFSYFGLAKNSKDVTRDEIVKVKNRTNALTVRRNLEAASQTNSPLVNNLAQPYEDEDRTVKFREAKIEEFKNLSPKKDRDMEIRRSTVNPTFKGSYDTPGFAWEVALSGNYAYVADGSPSNEGPGLQIVDVSDPANPTFKGSYETPNNAAFGIAISGNYAYVAAGDSGGLQIVGISDPSNPTFESSYNTHGGAIKVALSGNYAYVADGISGLQIIDISDPSNPTFKGSYVNSLAFGIAISGNYAYVADGYSGLQIIDISDPSNPILKGLYNTPGLAYGVALSGNYAYVANGESGLWIIDISNPSNPTFTGGSYDTPGSAFGVALFDNYAYVADGESGLQIIDISNPSNPTFKGSYNTTGSAWEVALSGNYAYVADGFSGLQIIAINILTDLAITLIIIGSITGAVCMASFCCLLIGGGIVILKRRRNKILGNENGTKTKDQQKEEGEQKVPMVSKEDIELEVLPHSIEEKITK